MVLGKVWPAGYLEIHVEVSATATATGSGRSDAGGGTGTRYRNAFGTLVEGVGIGMVKNDSGSWEGFASAPGHSQMYFAYHDLSAKIHFDGVYAAETFWVVKNVTVEIYADGALDQTWALGDLDTFYSGLFTTKNPSSIPLLGYPALTEAQANAHVALHSGDSASSSCDVTGGYRWVIGGTPIAFSALLDILDPPPNDGTCTIPDLPPTALGDTWSVSLSDSASVSSSIPGPPLAPEFFAAQGNGINPVPDLPRRLRKIGADYSGILVRAGLPRAGRESNSNCGAHVEYDADTRIVERGTLLDIVPFAPSAYEDALGDVPESVYYASTYIGHESGTAEGATSAYAGAYGPPTGYLPVLNNTNQFLRYWDMLCNPHWSHASWFEDWPVDDDPSPDMVNGYWIPGKHQYQYNSAIDPEREGLQTRNIVPLDAIGSARSYWESFVSHNFRQLGLSRWQTVDIVPRVSYTYAAADASLITYEDCSLILGGSITVTPDTGMTVMNVFVAMASYTAGPRMWPQIADQLRLDWTVTNIVSVKVFLVGVDDSEVEVPIVKNTWTDLPRGPLTEYAGSWGIYNGVDGLVNDFGTDLLGNGISATLMASAETAGAFQLLPGSTRTKMRIEITVADSTTPVTIKYPELRRNDGRDPMVAWESGQCAAIMWPDNACIRFGQESWWNYALDELRTTPAVVGLGYQTTVIDAFCWANVWLAGVAADTGLAALCTTLYDANEGNDLVDVAYGTAGVVLPGPTWTRFQLAMANLLAEVPPLCLMPTRERDSDWKPTGDWCLDSWSQFIGTLRFVAPGSTEPELRIGGSKVSAVELGWPDGFTVAGARPVVFNDEWGKIRYGDLELATVRPWHGYYWVAQGVSVVAGAVANCHDPWNPYYRALARDGNIFVERWPGYRPVGAPSSFQVTFGGGDSDPAIAVDRRRSLWLVFMRGGAVRLCVSHDDGETVEDLGTVF